MLLPGKTQVTDFWLVTPQGDGVFPRITWSGTVRSSGGEAVADATVIAIDLQGIRLATQCRTDRSGRYEMIDPRAGNNYILYASKPGYTPTPIVVRTGADKKLDLVLSPNKAGPDSLMLVKSERHADLHVSTSFAWMVSPMTCELRELSAGADGNLSRVPL
jgi:hypothetical protein